MRRDDRAVLDHALRRARLSAFAPGEFVGQESFMCASEILSLAVQAGIAPGVCVLDVCCGVGGPGRFITRELGCTYTGVDVSSTAIGIARERAGPGCRFEVSRIPPLPAGPYDVVLLLETLLAFPDKQTLLREVSSALTRGGRFAFTVEEGEPLTEAERRRMPAADTVWPIPLPDLLVCLERAGLWVGWKGELSRSHQITVDSLIDAFSAEASVIRAHLGNRALDDLLAAHRLWSDWLRQGRVRKFAFVAEKVADDVRYAGGLAQRTTAGDEASLMRTVGAPLPSAGTTHTSLVRTLDIPSSRGTP
jgi:SAM-dependent methyltransferase